MADLSPAAQAVLDAAKLYKEPEKYHLLEARVAAAALQAAVAATQMRYTWGDSDIEHWYCDANELLAIAAELENYQ